MAARGNRHIARVRGAIFGAITALALAGCTSVSDVGSYALVLQDRYAYTSCQEIAAMRISQASREKELVGLIAKANSGGIGGALVGATTYRSELELTRGHIKFLAKAEQEKGCPPPRP